MFIEWFAHACSQGAVKKASWCLLIPSVKQDVIAKAGKLGCYAMHAAEGNQLDIMVLLLTLFEIQQHAGLYFNVAVSNNAHDVAKILLGLPQVQYALRDQDYIKKVLLIVSKNQKVETLSLLLRSVDYSQAILEEVMQDPEVQRYPAIKSIFEVKLDGMQNRSNAIAFSGHSDGTINPMVIKQPR